MATRKLVGEKIKGIREDKKLTLEQVAENSGLDIAIVREIEENKNIPSLAPLIKIARALGVRLGTFLDDSDNLGPVVCRAGEATKAMSTSNATARSNSHLDFASLANQKAGRHMEPFIINITNKETETLQKSSHEGEEFIYVMEGKVKIVYGQNEYLLEAGDSIYYDSIVDHLVCAAENHARILAVVYTPF
ncbi:MAG: helix-turn-helix transcriptional regulator [Paludibacteraceae bacterium]|nr:helix-turn-helix transcriptional regulator [Paludibacteraceae bacterium]